ncbi:Xaa-Pro peptidase family protein [Bacillus sp. DTU_2020_1000418_1_SI_GHA_SEK_038]|uniref:M24 family metallopeptidase n=1 Tax=Bacillus sp. DTU_2020_1000418_1_SI_GHA_SEK_038 TaxID=3077585 RepID=UPI0028ECE359|nr:Xaa-Pro peptidase family protein [Bacillus sp. DTU_2020_1000418_1_SI_GHA_SEK_038]WNS74713.1 Xaa-Pro peptidase family protein [Bacillus sp. DTU_2020_1000418_1_SI_GHA_SEK_038]
MKRLEKLREMFDSFGIDAMLITNDQNRRYMTGFTGSAGLVLITKEEALLVVDFRYVEQANEQAKDFSIIQVSTKAELLAEIVRQTEQLNISKLGFEQTHVSFYSYSEYQKKLRAELVPLTGAIEKLRMIKDEEEISIIREAAGIADAAFTHILEFIKPGITEIEVSNELEAYMRNLGATSSAFDTIVASGHRGAFPHGVASSKVIEKGDMVTLDYGAYYKGYRSDITRTVAVGEPSEDLKGIYNIVLEALTKALDGIKPGITGKTADAFSRDFITEKGYGKQYGHGSGHGIGLDIHEEPFKNVNCEIVIESGMVLTVEPGIYIPNLGGVRIEDDILITVDGNEIITKSPKELIVL